MEELKNNTESVPASEFARTVDGKINDRIDENDFLKDPEGALEKMGAGDLLTRDEIIDSQMRLIGLQISQIVDRELQKIKDQEELPSEQELRGIVDKNLEQVLERAEAGLTAGDLKFDLDNFPIREQTQAMAHGALERCTTELEIGMDTLKEETDALIGTFRDKRTLDSNYAEELFTDEASQLYQKIRTYIENLEDKKRELSPHEVLHLKDELAKIFGKIPSLRIVLNQPYSVDESAARLDEKIDTLVGILHHKYQAGNEESTAKAA